MTSERPPAPHPLPFAFGPRGLCPDCRHVRAITSERGSTFWLCELSKRDPAYPRYPPQPRVSCAGFER
ncbi:MAG TPA: hypothetical protein VMT18_14845 [Planctomycetota bacterium]|nr:hypothetical protein [Planctomycetota bacterium]